MAFCTNNAQGCLETIPDLMSVYTNILCGHKLVMSNVILERKIISSNWISMPGFVYPIARLKLKLVFSGVFELKFSKCDDFMRYAFLLRISHA